jgi:hypothetical protein
MNVAVDAQIRVEYTGMVSDRYMAVHDEGGNIPMYTTSGVDGLIEWTQYALQPGLKYNVEIGWMCLVMSAGEVKSKNYILDTASFTTAQ